MDPAALDEAKLRLRQARSVAALTGAGVSAESGVPTFRGPEGLWRNFRPEELATPEAFSADPVLVWQWYAWRRGKISSVEPNGAHYALVDIERNCRDFTLVTQNVDGLHTLAGSRNVLEIHGSIWTLRCTACHRESENRDTALEIPPRCGCGAMMRPGVVWFGERLPEGVLERAFEAASRADFMIVAGTSGVVQPAASLALRARSSGAFVVEINPERTPLSASCDLSIRSAASSALTALADDS